MLEGKIPAPTRRLDAIGCDPRYGAEEARQPNLPALAFDDLMSLADGQAVQAARRNTYLDVEMNSRIGCPRPADSVAQ